MREISALMVSRLRFGISRFAQTPLLGRVDRRHWINFAYLVMGTLLVVAPLIYMGLFQIVKSDHDLHIHHIQNGIESGVWLVHFLFAGIVYAMSGFSHEYNALARAAFVFLTLCVIAKAGLTYAILVRSCHAPAISTWKSDSWWSHETLLLIVTAALLLSAPLVRPWQANRVYLGQISPNVWHNPTSLLCWPIVLLLFFTAYDFLRSGRSRMLWVIAGLALLSVLAKPNYFLAWAPVFGLLTLWRFGISRSSVLAMLSLLPTVAMLYWQLTASFGGPDAMRADRHLAWMPLAAWQLHSKSIPLSILFSLAFPLSYVGVFRCSLQNRGLLLYAWAVLLLAVAWAICFAEVRTSTGAADFDFNFSWGAHLAMFVLFLVTAIDMCDNPAALAAIRRHSLASRWAQLPWWLLGLHAASGILWIIRQASGKGFA